LLKGSEELDLKAILIEAKQVNDLSKQDGDRSLSHIWILTQRIKYLEIKISKLMKELSQFTDPASWIEEEMAKEGPIETPEEKIEFKSITQKDKL